MPTIDWIGLKRPQELAFDEARCRKSGDSWKFPLCSGLSGNESRFSLTLLLGEGVASLSTLVASPRAACCRIASTRFLARPLRFSYLDVSIEAALRRTDFPGFASGFSIHQDDLPVPSFCTRMNRLCSDRLCLIEFFHPALLLESPLSLKYGTFCTIHS